MLLSIFEFSQKKKQRENKKNKKRIFGRNPKNNSCEKRMSERLENS
jgi:hypothetical protein